MSSATCPSCSAPATGKFCAECGAAVGGATCASCRATLTPGAKFCHRCGLAAGGSAPTGAAGAAGAVTSGRQSPLPWAVAGVALLALVAFAAARNFNSRSGSSLDGSANALPQAGLDFAQGDPNAGAAAAGAGARAPDISQMSPAERADRLHDRVMRLAAQGRTDSVQFFLPMALQSYDQLASAAPLTADQRYHLGQLHEAGGDVRGARAQADSILRDDPTHLLGLVLGARAAGAAGDREGQRAFRQRLVAAEAEEMGKTTRPEYQSHREDLAQSIADAKRS